MPVLRLLLALALLAGPVLADTNADVRAHFKKGQMHYALGEFPEAISEFREAFRLKQEPAILFNLAQTYRQLHEWQHAYFHYRQYLIAKPNAPNRAEVEGFIEQMKNHMDEEDRAARADFNHRVDGSAAQASPAVAQTAPPAAAQATPSPETSDAPRSGPAAQRDPASPAPQSSSVGAASASRSNLVPPESSGSTASAPVAQAAGPAAVGAAPQSPPVVLSPRLAAAAQKPDFVDSSPGPIIVEKHVSAWRYTGYAAIGLGLVAGGVAYAMHNSAQSSADQFNSKYQAGALTPADSALRDDSQSKGKLATESLIAGIALVAAGGALTIAF